MRCVLYHAWWDACPLYDQHSRVVCLAVRPARAANKAAPHTADPWRMQVMCPDRTLYGVRCARRGSGVCVPCRAWLRRPSAHQVHFAQRYAMWWCAAQCGACVHDESVGAIVVRVSA